MKGEALFAERQNRVAYKAFFAEKVRPVAAVLAAQNSTFGAFARTPPIRVCMAGDIRLNPFHVPKLSRLEGDLQLTGPEDEFL